MESRLLRMPRTPTTRTVRTSRARSYLGILGLVAASGAVACADRVTAPPNSNAAFEPTFAVTADASELPNVVRFRDQFVFLIADPESDLIAFAGLPDDLDALCAGSEVSFAPVDVRIAGVRQEILKSQIVGQDANLDVWRLSTFEGVCSSPRLAHGTGMLRFHSNDLLDAGSHAVQGYLMEGDVGLASGGTAHLLGHNLFQTLPDGTMRRVFRQVRLTSQ